jgi:sulfate permease, SulP family
MFLVLRFRFSGNWRSGLAVALVSMPLSISLALASGATAQMGIITSVWAGLVAALLGGSDFNIAGPTGALSGILASYALLHGVHTLPILAIITGIRILVVYVIRLERYIVLIPASVLHGFTLGVALIIGLGQLNAALGLTNTQGRGSFVENLAESFAHIGTTSVVALATTILGVVFLLSAVRLIPKLPAITILSTAGIGLGYMSARGIVPFSLATIMTKYGAIGHGLVALPKLSGLVVDSGLFMTAATVTVVAILETLISGKIADGMTHTRFDQRKELFGLAIGNIASGVFGGIPATAALARTSLNVKAGAKSKWSGIISSAIVGVVSLILLPYFQYLPLSVVAAILIYVAINMVEAEHFRKLLKVSKRSFSLALLVATLTVTWEPLFAIGTGTVIALLIFVDRLSEANVEISVNDADVRLVSRIHGSELPELEHEDSTIVYRFAGELIYINAQAHMTNLENIHEDTKALIFSLRNLYFIDMDGSDMLAEIIDDLHDKNIMVFLTGINAMIAPMLRQTFFYRDLERRGRVLPSTQAALAVLRA